MNDRRILGVPDGIVFPKRRAPVFRNTGMLSRAAAVVALASILAGCTTTKRGSRDHLLGWFKLPGRNEHKEVISGHDTLIPVFKRAGTYYSVCRGFEVPLKECPEGLEWGLLSSSMKGTKIGWDASSNTLYLAVLDAQASNFTDGRYGVGDKETLTQVEKPPGLLDAKARRPRTHDDFLGWFQPVWFPWMKIEVRKNNDRYCSIIQAADRPGDSTRPSERHELTPLPDQLGFSGCERGRGTRLVYNDSLRRFELLMSDAKRTPPEIRMPLARIPAPASSERHGVPPPAVRIGIPSWH